MAEHLLWEQDVVGSIPATLTCKEGFGPDFWRLEVPIILIILFAIFLPIITFMVSFIFYQDSSKKKIFLFCIFLSIITEIGIISWTVYANNQDYKEISSRYVEISDVDLNDTKFQVINDNGDLVNLTSKIGGIVDKKDYLVKITFWENNKCGIWFMTDKPKYSLVSKEDKKLIRSFSK